MMIRFHTLLVLGHLLALSLGLGAALLADWVVLRKLTFGNVSQRAAGQLIDLSHAVSTGLVLIWVTGALLVADSAWDVPASIMNQKLWAKLVIVAILTLNALLLHGLVLPRVVSRVGQPLFETSFGWLPLISTLFGAVSAVSWTFAACLGLARELNGHANLVPILGSYLIALLLTWVAAVMLSHLLRHRRLPPGSRKSARDMRDGLMAAQPPMSPRGNLSLNFLCNSPAHLVGGGALTGHG